MKKKKKEKKYSEEEFQLGLIVELLLSIKRVGAVASDLLSTIVEFEEEPKKKKKKKKGKKK